MKYDYIIMARPTYVSRVTPRFDSVSRSGVIRGSAPIDMKQTAITRFPIVPDESDYPSRIVLQQYNLSK